MSSTTTTLGVLVLLIAVNQVLMKLPFIRHQAWLYWTIQVTNIAVAVVTLTFGLPGLVSAARWIVGALFLFHFVQNLQTRMSWSDEARAERREAEARERHRQQELDHEEELARRREAEASKPPADPSV